MDKTQIAPVEPVKNFRLDAALSYAARGWKVFPIHTPSRVGDVVRCSCAQRERCGSIGKHPRTGNGLSDATDNPATIRGWWEQWPAANVGIVTGAASGLLVIDVDTGVDEHGEPKNGDVVWAELTAAYGDPPLTPLCETGSGGFHFFFKYPGAVASGMPNPWRNSAELLGKGIDTRGDGGYVVAAPSLHETDAHYDWRVPPDIVPLADAPVWVQGILRSRDSNRLTVTQGDAVAPSRTTKFADAEEFWLGRALAKVTEGTRNDTGFWLATQLRDAQVVRAAAERVMLAYADRVPRGAKPYTSRESLASLEQAYKLPPREIAKNFSKPAAAQQSTQKLWTPPTVADNAASIFNEDDDTPFDAPIHVGASAELGKFYEGIIDGSIAHVPLPWPIVSELTQALIPGTTTIIVGDPGVGKTYMLLQSLLFWQQEGIDAAVYFIEKRRRFYTMRLLAYLEGSTDFLSYTWIHLHPEQVRAALAKHAKTIDAIGRMMYSSAGQQVTFDSLMGWIRQMASAGKRVICVDPITAVAADVDRWTKDTEFVIQGEALAEAHGASLLYVTHAKKGNRPHAPSGHDAALGAAYFRFSDTDIWLDSNVPANHRRKLRTVRIRHSYGTTTVIRPQLFYQLHKARNGKGTGYELAYTFGSGMRFAEQGIVIEDVDEDEARQVAQTEQTPGN